MLKHACECIKHASNWSAGCSSILEGGIALGLITMQVLAWKHCRVVAGLVACVLSSILPFAVNICGIEHHDTRV